MPRACHFLYTLDRDPNTAPIDARVAACTGRLEKVFRYGVGIAAKLTPSGEFADVYRRDRDEQLATLFRDARVVVKELLQSRRSWFSQRDGQRAVMKLDGMTFAFGARHNFRQYEAYRKTPDLNTGPNASVLDAIFALFSHASSLYWSAFTTSAERSVAYDNTYTTSAFDWDGEYQPTNNHLFLPNGVVGFLSALSNQMPLQLYPVLSQNIVRTMLQALLKGNSLLDGNGTAVSEPWGEQTQRQYDSAMACLRRHHDADEDVERRGDSPWTIADSEAIFLDSAVIGPTYELYNRAIQGHNETGLSVSVDTRVIGPKRLFFYNYASAHCDYDDLELRRVRSPSRSSPSKIRLNLALNNFPPFLETFSCAAAEGPGDRCVIWKGPASAKSMRSIRKVPSNLTYHLLAKSGETNATNNLESRSSIND
ncbi:hypothetical protein HPB50_002840 [Hyalomma asiaticum]|uniref:Uncharacterized protein n=1 Tax=Hyalomma asiaticum TaxID=266040 RepID=A0ACB7SBU6_HYAAI|nr:hypothetical protein HPB50_002840 [Hyalomma asiaticum]